MSIDINAADFVPGFDIKKGTVGVVGHGYVGQAVVHFFSKACRVLVYDKAKPQLGTLDSVVSEAEVVFVAVPTPMEPDGRCHTGIVESVLDDVKAAAARVGRNLNTFVVVCKSTVPPGFTEEMQYRHYDMRLCFSPEFLTEASSIEDFEKQNRVIIGGDEEDALVVFKFFEGVAPKRVEDGSLLCLHCGPTTAEMVKLYANGMLATKVLFSNEVYEVCSRLGVEYEEVRMLACLDRRIGSGHTLVPGPDGFRGYGGHCLYKDLNNIRYVARQLGTGERLFTTLLERNDELREKEGRDWENMKGRAVID